LPLPNQKILKRAHFTVGWLTLAAFAASGVYLRVKAPSIYLGDEVSHMMFRANHIYILMAGIANVAIGRYVVEAKDVRARWMQSMGMGLMLASSALFIYAFTLEPMLGSMERPRTTLAVFLLAGGTLLHVLSGILDKK
jgi:ABC-type transport system involved in cytochrome c biogenesis permease subunit